MLFSKNLEIQKIKALRDNLFNYDKKIILSNECVADLNWVLVHLPGTTAPIHEPPPDYRIKTDASKLGYGFYDPQTGVKAGGRWSAVEAACHINELELTAIEFGLRSLCVGMKAIHIRIITDSKTAMCCVNRQGSTKVRLNRVARRIWEYAISKDLWLSAEYIPGKENFEADEASRVFDDNTEWSIRNDIFDSICSEFGKPTIDLFASRLNHKNDRYISLEADPGAIFNDAFLYDWGNDYIYAFPPFSVIRMVVSKCIQDRAKGILIIPDWPSQPWYTLLNKLVVRDHFLIPVNTDEIFLPFDLSRSHPLAGKLKLKAVVIDCTQW